MHLKIGSRDSLLAIAQANILIKFLNQKGIKTTLITKKTTGDLILNKPLDAIGGKGLFVKELDMALLNKQVDLCVHSFKDMPMEINPSLTIAAVSKRENPCDVLILPKGVDNIDYRIPLGTCSRRRKVQLLSLYPNAQLKDIRGNIQTRLNKLDNKEYSGLILAYAGIKRLGLERRIQRIFSVDEILPAACQGALAVLARNDFDENILEEFNHTSTMYSCYGERSFVRELNGTCSMPIGSYGHVKDASITLTGLYAKDVSMGSIIKKTICGNISDSETLGITLAKMIKEEINNVTD